MWLLLINKALSWEILQKRITYCLRRCPLCKENEESNLHLIMTCSYDIHVWEEVKGLTRLRNIWSDSSIEEGLRSQCENENVKRFRAYPLLLSQGIWLTKNVEFFEEKSIPLCQCVTQSLNILTSFNQVIKDKPN